jgi:hypothetical protein
MSAAIRPATQSLEAKSWFRSRLIAISELLCAPNERRTLLTVFSAAAALRATNGGGVRAIYNLPFLGGREWPLPSYTRAWAWKQAAWGRHAAPKWRPRQFPRGVCFVWFAAEPAASILKELLLFIWICIPSHYTQLASERSRSADPAGDGPPPPHIVGVHGLMAHPVYCVRNIRKKVLFHSKYSYAFNVSYTIYSWFLCRGILYGLRNTTSWGS